MAYRMKRFAQRIGLVMIFFLLGGLCYIVQVKIEVISPANHPETLLYLPSGKCLKPLMLGFDELAADFLWIKAIGYFGGHSLTDKSYKWLYHLLDLTTTLDPHFRYPYEFGGIILSAEQGDVEQSNKLLMKGRQYHPKYWRFPFYLGFNKFFYQKDAPSAAHFLAQASSLPGHPAYLPKLSASLYAYAGQRDTAIDFLTRMCEDLRDPELKYMLMEKASLLEQGILPKTLQGLLVADP